MAGSEELESGKTCQCWCVDLKTEARLKVQKYKDKIELIVDLANRRKTRET